jgi:tetratricopeptide (TPR) repeat protein
MSRHYFLPAIFGIGATISLIQSTATAKSAIEIGEIAKAITVRITSDIGGNGSGIILQQQGDVYTVLTAAHVVRQAGNYSVKTPDDRTYQILGDSIRKVSGDVDLAIVKFRSSTSYTTARLGNSNLLRSGTEIYVAGFPAPTRVITQSIFVLRPGLYSNPKSVSNDINGAFDDYSRAIVANPNFVHAYYNRALLKIDFLDDRPGAIADFRAAVRLHRQAGNTEMSQQAIDRLRSLGVNFD